MYVSDDIGADSTLEREIAPILSIGDAFPKILITRTRHEPHTREGVLVLNFARWLLGGSSPVEWCNRFVSFGVGYALSWSGGSSCWVGWGVSRDLVRMSRLR